MLVSRPLPAANNSRASWLLPVYGCRVSLLTARGVTVAYGDLLVLHNADLSVAAGDRIAVVGPNGAGKSTLLRVLAGEVRPDSGTVTVAGTVGYLPQERDRRSGETAMGYIARRTGVAAADRAMLTASERLAAGEPGADSDYAAALERYLVLGGPDLEVRASELAATLGLPADLDRVATGLSGGQAARLALAAVLLARFDVLLLDEPTNDLDLAGLELLEDHLTGYRGGVVVVSHDRSFLDVTARDVLRIDPHSREVKLYGGGYQAYKDELERDRAAAAQAYEAYAAKREYLIERARRQKEWARSGERSNKSAAARRKEPDKHIRHFRTAEAQHVGARAAATLRAVDRLDRNEQVAEPRKEWELRLRFGAASRSGDVVAVIDGAVVRRGAFTLGPVSLQLNWGDRMLVRGDNGSGKTTLLQALLGRIPLDEGRGTLGASVVIGEIDQARQTFGESETLADAFCAASGLLPGEARTLLAKFGLGADDVGRRIDRLSPGERTRADLALLMHSGANLLVLDEPTNHLDLPAIQQLEQALEQYDGTLLLVTHDRTLAERVTVTRTVVVRDGVVTQE